MSTLLKLGSAAVAVLLLAGQAQAGQIKWTVYGDYGNTVRSNNVNRFDTRVNMAPQPLTNFATGFYVTNEPANLQVLFWATNSGSPMTAATQCTNPTTGPLTAYTNILNFGGNNNVTVSRTVTNMLVFTNLDPSLRYTFIAGVTRGALWPQGSGSTYTNRLSKAWVSGAETLTVSHQADPEDPYGILTVANITETGLLTGNEVAWWSAGRYGNVISWSNIDPGSDGSLSFDVTQFYSANPVTSHGAFTGSFIPDSGSYGYGWDGWVLIAEVPCEQFTVVLPEVATNIECGSFTLTPDVLCGYPEFGYQWSKLDQDGNPIDLTGDAGTAPSLVFNPIRVADAGVYMVTVFDNAPGGGGMAVSGFFTNVVLPNNSAPALVSAITTDANTILVTFDQPLYFSSSANNWGVIKVNGAGALPIGSAVSNSPTTITITTTQPLNDFYKVVASNTVRTCTGVQASPSTSFALIQYQWKLIDFASTEWQFNQAGTDLFSDWLVNTYDDHGTGWETGTNIFDQTSAANPRTNLNGYVVHTFLTLTNPTFSATANVPSYYFRTHVTMPTDFDPVTTKVNMRYMVDDGLVLYVNGQEAYRTTNVVNGSNYNYQYYLVNGGVTATPAISTNVSLDPNLFLSGDNVIGVYLKQVNATSSDATMGMEMSTVVTNIVKPTREVYVHVSPSTTNVNQCSPFTLAAVATGGTKPYTYQWYKGTTPISGETGATLTIANPQPGVDNGAYNVQVTDSASPAYVTNTSQSGTSGTVTIINDPVPVLLTAISQIDRRTIRLAFNKAVTTNGTLSVTLSPAVAVSSATPVNNTNINLVLAADLQNKNYTVTLGSGIVGACSGTAVPGSVALVQQIPLSTPFFNTGWQVNDSATDLGTNWLANDYVDTGDGWRTANQIFDWAKTNAEGVLRIVGTNTIASALALTNVAWSNGLADIPSYYFRQHITLPFAADPNNIVINYQGFFDDYGVIYINGQEIYRDNQINANNYAFTNYSGGGKTDAGWTQMRSLTNYTILSQGDNVLAVYLKQSTYSSSDSTMGMWVTATVTNFPATGPSMTVVQDDTKITITWPTTEGCTLYYRTDLGTVAKATDLTSWTAFPAGSITSSGGTSTAVINKPTTGNRFFLLKP